MGIGRTHATQPDLFSVKTGDEPTLPSAQKQPNNVSRSKATRYVLPNNLDQMIKHLDDQGLDRLFAVVLAENKRRGREHPASGNKTGKRQVETAVTLTTSKTNAIRAAFRAGVKPSQIARQFGVSQEDIRRALRGD